MRWFRRKGLEEPRAERIRLSVGEPPCRCREPLVAEAARSRDERVLDVRMSPGAEVMGPALRAVDSLGAGERLRVRAHSLYWPLMAALLASGCHYQVLGRAHGTAEFLVWRFYSPEERTIYLQGCMCEASRAG
ncbi:MAG TPA: hypothetical protein VK929_03485 [Longimicrobiales bacterium]|nr:hypothetical protein [Longimicrobiales bacterium]